jgi:hypothetical protein
MGMANKNNPWRWSAIILACALHACGGGDGKGNGVRYAGHKIADPDHQPFRKSHQHQTVNCAMDGVDDMMGNGSASLPERLRRNAQRAFPQALPIPEEEKQRQQSDGKEQRPM